MQKSFAITGWRSLVEVVPSISYLQGDEATSFVNEYNARVGADYNDNANLKVLSARDGLVRGSNSFANALVNDVMLQQGVQLATQADLERAMAVGAMNFRGTYEDTGLVLRTAGDSHAPNDYLAKNLAEQIRARDAKMGKLNKPVVINLRDVTLVNDADSKYGLAFKLREGAMPYEAPVLKREGRFETADINAKTGLPKETRSSGSRTLWTRDNGLSRLYLVNVLDVYSNDENLAFSNGDGRVVLVRGEAAGADFVTGKNTV